MRFALQREPRFTQILNVVSRRVPGARGHEALDIFYGLYAAACAKSRAVQRRGGASELELALEWPVLKQRVDESGMKNIPGAGGVHGLHPIGRSVVELRAVPG